MGDLIAGQLVWAAAEDDDDVVTRFQGRMERAQRLAHQALAAVTLVRLADFLAGNDGLSVRNGVIGKRKHTNHEGTQCLGLAS